MNIAEKMISLLAPHECLGCNREGSLLCSSCRIIAITTLPSRCFVCHKATRQSAVCESCKHTIPLEHVWVATEYSELPKQLVYKLKFGRASAAAQSIARSIYDELPLLPKETIVTHIPTASSRIRSRGYDQAQLIAKAVAAQSGWKYKPLLVRVNDSRQVGSSREQRFAQMESAFALKKNCTFQGADILLIDDVVTTGATLQAASKQLKAAGVKTVNAAVFAAS